MSKHQRNPITLAALAVRWPWGATPPATSVCWMTWFLWLGKKNDKHSFSRVWKTAAKVLDPPIINTLNLVGEGQEEAN